MTQENFVTNLRRISYLEARLNETNEIAFAYLDGDLTEEEYAETKAQRKVWRAEIKLLKQSLKGV